MPTIIVKQTNLNNDYDYKSKVLKLHRMLLDIRALILLSLFPFFQENQIPYD